MKEVREGGTKVRSDSTEKWETSTNKLKIGGRERPKANEDTKRETLSK